MKKLDSSHIIENTITGEKSEHQGHFKGINIISEKAHNKNITKITGLE